MKPARQTLKRDGEGWAKDKRGLCEAGNLKGALAGGEPSNRTDEDSRALSPFDSPPPGGNHSLANARAELDQITVESACILIKK